MCGNSLSNKTAFSLECLGGFRFPDLCVFVLPANIPGCVKTIKGFQVQQHDLHELAMQHLPDGCRKYNNIVPRGWGSEALCTN